MYKDRKIVVVVPAHNEEGFIGGVIETMPDFVDAIVVVDDCSSDRTAERAIAQRDRRVHVVHTEKQTGVGGATKLGYVEALSQAADVIVKMDGDGQMPPELLAPLIDPLIEGGYSYSKGNRLSAGRPWAGMPRGRLVGNVLLGLMSKFASGYWNVADPQNGFTAITREALQRVDLDAVSQGFFFEDDMLIQLNVARARVKDVPMPAKYGSEVSDIRVSRVAFTFPWLFLRGFWHRLFRKYVVMNFSPMAVFFCLGTLLFSGGALGGIVLWIKSSISRTAASGAAVVLVLLPIVLGFLLLLHAVVLDARDVPQ